VAAGAVLPVTALSVRRPGLRPLAALLWHQTEEWFWPGGFMPWFNREVVGSDEDEFPLDRRGGFINNAVVGWTISAATMAGRRAALPSALLYTSHFGNATLHLSWAARKRRYDPGSITAIATLLPVASHGLKELISDPDVPRWQVGAGIAGGVAASVALLPVYKRRLANARASR
jgi:hypothetical protein